MVKEAKASKASKCMFMTSERKASEDADKDIERLSNASCAVKLNMMSDESRMIGWRSKEAEDQEGIDKL